MFLYQTNLLNRTAASNVHERSIEHVTVGNDALYGGDSLSYFIDGQSVASACLSWCYLPTQTHNQSCVLFGQYSLCFIDNHLAKPMGVVSRGLNTFIQTIYKYVNRIRIAGTQTHSHLKNEYFFLYIYNFFFFFVCRNNEKKKSLCDYISTVCKIEH